MKKTAVFLALTSLFASTTSWAEPFRLAFSKAEQIEIFVDRAPDGSWCSPSLNMRAVYGGEPDHAALVRLMPKVGALLDAHCAEATLVTWEARDKNGAQLAYGNSAKSEGWQLVHAPERTASASAGAKGHVAALQGAVANQDTQQTAALDMRTEKVATGAEEREALEVARADDRQAERIAREEQRASARKQANAEREAKRLALAEERRARQAALEAERAAARLAAEQAKAKKIAAQKAAAEQAEAEKLAAQRAALEARSFGAGGFSVNNWVPQSEAEVLGTSAHITEMADQNNCKVRTQFTIEGNPEYISLATENLRCNASGYAEGHGRLALTRSDGAIISQSPAVYVKDGFPFSRPMQSAKVVASDERHLWFDLGHDTESKTYFLLRTSLTRRTPISILDVDPTIDALTEGDDMFRRAEHIQLLIDKALDALQTTAFAEERRANIVFGNDLGGITEGKLENLFYKISAHRSSPFGSRELKPWEFNLASGVNYVFQQDERRAQQQRQQLRQLAYKEEENLRLYDSLSQDAEVDPERLLARLIDETEYSPFTGGTVRALLRGHSMPFNSIVRISDIESNDAKVDYPYDLRLTDASDLLKGQWYFVKGKATLDMQRKDNQGLAMTSVSAAPDDIRVCVEPGCTELTDPLVMTRILLKRPEWSPEHARNIIEQANAS